MKWRIKQVEDCFTATERDDALRERDVWACRLGVRVHLCVHLRTYVVQESEKVMEQVKMINAHQVSGLKKQLSELEKRNKEAEHEKKRKEVTHTRNTQQHSQIVPETTQCGSELLFFCRVRKRFCV